MAIHLRFSGFTFSFNQIQLLTHQTDPYRHKERESKKWLQLHNWYLIYSKKSVFNFLLLVVVAVVVVVVVIVQFRHSGCTQKNHI